MKKILVTGSNGFLASRFIDFYKDKYDIVPLTRNTLDITVENQVLDFFKHNKFDLVFHTAAISDTQKCEREPDLAEEINVRSTLNIAKACTLKNSTLVFASSDQIFNGNSNNGPYAETILPNPNTVYGHTKFECETRIKEFMDNYYNLRLTWLFTFPERCKKVNTNIITNTLNAIFNNSKLKLSDNEFRGMTYVYDVIENFEKLITLPYGDYNYGSENNLSTYDIACYLLKSMNLSNRIDSTLIMDAERFKDLKRDLRISNKKLKENSIIFPITTEGLMKCIYDFGINK
ncbi:SDR family oxidoreductase [Clostridium frigidicarnis]|uniref:dTDP-4-dehydrorhamnose reductase n=1 Tax=Clostridium frigidicarnis TaxID=84698 RepID=A0A1I0YHD2_9CLOT|nr:sugar nucleotide-binding protein [Clostridium frigidicarnis]SFB12779.1 dTDP-4-dehydrorhamnose reductase [Clostridium frigidicarnis]